MKIFVVYSSSHDSYEDYGYFSKREVAEEFRKLYNNVPLGYRGGNLHIKEIKIDLPRENWFQYYVRMTKEGKVIEVHNMMLEKEGFVCFDSEKNLLWCFTTTDKEVAIKKTNDARLKILKNGDWDNQFLGRKEYE